MVQAELFHNEVRNGKQPQRVANTNLGRPGQFAAQQVPVPIEQRKQGAQVSYRDNRSRTAGAAPGASPTSHEGNRVRLRGRIGRYFDVKRTQSGTLLAVFSVATVRPYRDESGNWQRKTVWQRIVVWGDAAQSVGEQLRKGAQVQVEGKLKTREWTDSENNLRTTTELVARDVRFVDAAENGMAA
jgi:single stranded DNA-binding protein